MLFGKSIIYLLLISYLIFSDCAIAQDTPEANESAFEGNAKLYDMTREELLDVSPKVLTGEINRLELRNEEEKKELIELQSFNQALCLRMQKLMQECSAMAYIADANGLDDLGCSDSLTSSEKPSITVELKGDNGGSFMFIANDKYISNEVSAQNKGPIIFKRNDSKLVKPPRFRDLTTLSIVSIRKGGKVGERTQRPENLEVKILVNGKPIMDDFTLHKPEDNTDISSYRINPTGLIDLRTKEECKVSLEEINNMKAKTQ